MSYVYFQSNTGNKIFVKLYDVYKVFYVESKIDDNPIVMEYNKGLDCGKYIVFPNMGTNTTLMISDLNTGEMILNKNFTASDIVYFDIWPMAINEYKIRLIGNGLSSGYILNILE
jgi:hypothetical protein